MLDKSLSDEVRVTVIATGLNGDYSKEYNSIPNKMTAEYSKAEETFIESKNDDRILAFKENNDRKFDETYSLSLNLSEIEDSYYI